MSVDHLYFAWFRSGDGTPMVRHQCLDGETDEFRPPPPWRFTGSGFEPSFHCMKCGMHLILGAADEDRP